MENNQESDEEPVIQENQQAEGNQGQANQAIVVPVQNANPKICGACIIPPDKPQCRGCFFTEYFPPEKEDDYKLLRSTFSKSILKSWIQKCPRQERQQLINMRTRDALAIRNEGGIYQKELQMEQFKKQTEKLLQEKEDLINNYKQLVDYLMRTTGGQINDAADNVAVNEISDDVNQDAIFQAAEEQNNVPYVSTSWRAGH